MPTAGSREFHNFIFPFAHGAGNRAPQGLRTCRFTSGPSWELTTPSEPFGRQPIAPWRGSNGE